MRTSRLSVLTALMLGAAMAGCAGEPAPVDAETLARETQPHESAAEVPEGAALVEHHVLVEHGGDSGIKVPQRLVIRDEAQWVEFLSASRFSPQGTVDFSRAQVIVAALGSRPATGYSVHIDSVWESPEALYVRVSEQQRCNGLWVRTRPLTAVAVPASSLPVRFIEHVGTPDCTTPSP